MPRRRKIRRVSRGKPSDTRIEVRFIRYRRNKRTPGSRSISVAGASIDELIRLFESLIGEDDEC